MEKRQKCLYLGFPLKFPVWGIRTFRLRKEDHGDDGVQFVFHHALELKNRRPDPGFLGTQMCLMAQCPPSQVQDQKGLQLLLQLDRCSLTLPTPISGTCSFIPASLCCLVKDNVYWLCMRLSSCKYRVRAEVMSRRTVVFLSRSGVLLWNRLMF